MSDTDSSERRRFHRILFDAPVCMELNKKTYQSELLDISLKGALVRTPTEWAGQVGDNLILRINLDDADTVITMQAICAHVEEERIGVLCKEIDMESISLLRRLVELNLADDEVLNRDLEALG
ncbi:MAG: PilZ domain-containing protein [Candidatus Thiodiazotropha sp. (ex Lucinoma borealis)]|nr:PilZ domain-containing protein [Candidatus Thiodiazotropha sp. (ex Lucinoma borealis)]MCU7871536.1 PilZ domain-containing protein [Candidatus Thiodiazotropha sp. (ex Lucinoma borealis)]